jgi:hypothetical protein
VQSPVSPGKGDAARPITALRALVARLGPLGTALVTIISTLSAVIALVTFIGPHETYAVLAIEHAEWPVTLRDFEPTAVALLEEAGEASPAFAFDEGQRNTRGAVIAYTAEMGGYQGKQCFLRWSMRGQPGNRPLDDPAFTDNAAWPIGALTPGNPRGQRFTRLWAPLPRAKGAYALELILICDGEEIDSAIQEGITVD